MESRLLPPRPNLRQYRKQAKDLLHACVSTDPAALHSWAEQWFDATSDQWKETESRLRGIPAIQNLPDCVRREEIDRIEKRVRSSKLSEPDPKLAEVRAADSGAAWRQFSRSEVRSGRRRHHFRRHRNIAPPAARTARTDSHSFRAAAQLHFASLCVR